MRKMKNICIGLVLLLCCKTGELNGIPRTLNQGEPTLEKISLARAEQLVAKLSKADPWVRAPEGSTLAWGESYLLDAFMDLYEATKDTKYLEVVAERGKRLLTHRDDKRGVVDGSGESRPAWSVGSKYVVAEGVLLSTEGEELVKIRSTPSSNNNRTTIEVVYEEGAKRFNLLVRNEYYKRFETFNDLRLNFSPSYLKTVVNDPMAPYGAKRGEILNQNSNLIRIENVNKEAKGVIANQKITLTPIPLAFAGYVGVIYFPMMRFSETVKADPALSKFAPVADLFIQAAEESYADMSKRLWRSGPKKDEGYYLMCEKGESMPADNVGQPFNYLAKHVCTELALYRLTKKTEYLERATGVINLFANRLTYNKANDLYTWLYWYEPVTTKGWGPADNISYNVKYYQQRAYVEDLSHAGHNIRMVMEAYRMGIRFDEADMKRFANTFLKNALTPDRTKITRLVDGSGDNQAYFNALHQWFVLAEVNPEVAKAAEEIYLYRKEETLPTTARLLKYRSLL